MRLAERRRRVMELRIAGWTYDKIGKAFDVTPMTICNDVHAELARAERERGANVAEYRRIQMERIDRAIAKIWPSVAQGEYEAVDRLVKLMEREAKLLGLDAPARIDIRAKLVALAEAEGWAADEVVATGAQVVHLLEARSGS